MPLSQAASATPTKKASMRRRIQVFVLAVGASVAIIIGLAYYFSSSRLIHDKNVARFAHEISAIRNDLQTAFALMEADLNTLRAFPPLSGIVRSSENGGLDPLDGSSTAQWQQRLATIFSAIIEQRPSYSQLRFIGLADGGRELVRVDKNAAGIVVTADEDLQKMMAEPYMQAALRLQPGDIYYSPITLNREHGMIEEDALPTLRLATAVFDERGKMFGTLVINIDYESLLKEKLIQQQPRFYTEIADREENYISFSPENYSSKFELSNSNGDSQKLSESLMTKIFPNHLRQAYDSGSAEIKFKNQHHIAVKISESIVTRNQDLAFAVMQVIPKNALMIDIGDARLQALGIASLILICSIIVALTLSQWMTQPLEQICVALQRFEEGNGELHLPVHANDEIGDVARAFLSVLDKLKNSRQAEAELLLERESFFHNAIDGLISINDQGIVRMFNPACERIFGYSASEVIGQKINLLMPDSDAEIHDMHIDNYLSTRKKNVIGRISRFYGKRKDGSVFPLDLSVSELHIRGQRLFNGIIRDVSNGPGIDNIPATVSNASPPTPSRPE